jgi:hypothetical protein
MLHLIWRGGRMTIPLIVIIEAGDAGIGFAESCERQAALWSATVITLLQPRRRSMSRAVTRCVSYLGKTQ